MSIEEFLGGGQGFAAFRTKILGTPPLDVFDTFPYKANVYENLLNARKYVIDIGSKEHMVIYLASGKSVQASQVFSKQGGKGNRPLLENNLEQAGTELGQAQLQLELGFTLIKMCCITLMITN